ncbi:MAG: hypothetical protein MJZ97_09365 [Bacteroidales bacterium]|nr:hypothetical protein [Bacteroidales bacterium]
MKIKKVLIWLGGIVLSVVLERIFNLIPIEKLFNSERWSWLILNRFNIIDLIVFVIILVIVFIFIAKFGSKKSDKHKTKMEKYLEKINSIEVDKEGIKVTWDMYMGSMYDNDPHPYNIRLFCTKHDMPLLMQHGRCTDYNCPNAHAQCDEHAIKNIIESLLLNERDKFMKK